MLKWLATPATLVAVHTAFVVYMNFSIQTSPDPMAGMAWIVFSFIDPPVAIWLDRHHYWDPFSTLLIFGGLQWLMIGLLMSAVINGFISLFGKATHKSQSIPKAYDTCIQNKTFEPKKTMSSCGDLEL